MSHLRGGHDQVILYSQYSVHENYSSRYTAKFVQPLGLLQYTGSIMFHCALSLSVE